MNTMTKQQSLTPITDSHGRFPSHAYDREPNPGSVVLTHGEFGTAWQRYFDDGLWHRVGGGKGRTWAWMLTNRNLLLAYDAPARKE